MNTMSKTELEWLKQNVQAHYIGEYFLDITEDYLLPFRNIHGDNDKAKIYFSGQNKKVKISNVIDLTTDFYVAEGFRRVEGKNGVTMAFDYDFILKRGFVSMDYLISILAKHFDVSWYESEKEIILAKGNNNPQLK